MKSIIRASSYAIAALMLVLAPGARAQDQAQGQAQDRPCAADAARLCPGSEEGSRAQLACLKEHKTELSAACKKKIMEKKEEMKKEQPKPQPAPSPQP